MTCIKECADHQEEKKGLGNEDKNPEKNFEVMPNTVGLTYKILLLYSKKIAQCPQN